MRQEAQCAAYTLQTRNILTHIAVIADLTCYCATYSSPPSSSSSSSSCCFGYFHCCCNKRCVIAHPALQAHGSEFAHLSHRAVPIILMITPTPQAGGCRCFITASATPSTSVRPSRTARHTVSNRTRLPEARATVTSARTGSSTAHAERNASDCVA